MIVCGNLDGISNKLEERTVKVLGQKRAMSPQLALHESFRRTSTAPAIDDTRLWPFRHEMIRAAPVGGTSNFHAQLATATAFGLSIGINRIRHLLRMATALELKTAPMHECARDPSVTDDAGQSLVPLRAWHCRNSDDVSLMCRRCSRSIAMYSASGSTTAAELLVTANGKLMNRNNENPSSLAMGTWRTIVKFSPSFVVETFDSNKAEVGGMIVL